MTKQELGALVRGLIPGLQAYLAASLDPLHERIAALEAAVGQPGPTGPAGKDGKDGAPGRDGTLEGASLEQIDDRTWRLVRADGTPLIGVLGLSVPLDCGVYQASRTYQKGDGVTYAGSFWIAQAETREKPGDGVTKWRLAVKAGREGREGKPGKDGGQGPQGPRGEPGRNFS